ncbi:3-oxoadipate enol-lactonase [Hymenobacter jejuensis]|uniref:3-oxoadipate enol-lactonase n=1 Tax=Hymenobacter jejuensis TaxID=2502781 RepID=A0A5B8A7C0_9BACT|nr:3-oxoadipate enol-lactonase [Hymenobacter jejuensis]QDA62372.1 3-oxoadipate enol-lactonase [Hymenobacter jejuensis]
MPLLSTATGPVFYTLTGPVTAPVLVFSNSLGTDHTMWDAQLPALTAHFQVLRYDTRGHGQSAVTPGPYSAELLGRDVLALLDALQLERAHFCGISLGGIIGQWLGIYAPERLNKLILSNTAAKIGTAEGWNARIQQVEQEGLDALAEATIGRWFTPEFQQAQPAEVQRILQSFQRTSPIGYVACCAAVRDADFWQDVRRISAPTYVLAGTEDPVTTVKDGEYLAQHIPNAHLLPLRAAHLANIEAAPAFNAAVRRFLHF